MYLKKEFITFLIIFAAGCFAAVYEWLSYSPFELYPPPYDFFCYSYTDNKETEILSFNQKNNNISVEFVLDTAFEFSYAGIGIATKDDTLFEDISDYDILKLEFKELNIKHIKINLITSIPGYTDRDKVESGLYQIYTVQNIDTAKTFTIPLKKLVIPMWWYKNNNFDPSEEKNADYSKFYNLSVQNTEKVVSGEPRGFTISRISFHASLFKRFLTPLILLIISFFTFPMFFLYKIITRRKISIIPYHQIKTIAEKDNDVKSILDHIGNNYNNPDLDLSSISSETSIPQGKISSILHKQLSSDLRTLIRSIRIKEAARLLTESDLRISEIAYKVGFKYPSSFNRTFKEIKGVSPGDFRKQNKEA